MKKLKTLITIISILLFFSSSLFAAVEADWVYFSFDNYSWLTVGSHNIEGDTNKFRELGRVAVMPNKWGISYPPGYGKLTYRLSNPIGDKFELINIEDNSKRIGFTIQSVLTQSVTATYETSNSPIIYQVNYDNVGTENKINVSFHAPNGNPNDYVGTYAANIVLEILGKDGDLVEMVTYSLAVKFRGSSSSGGSTVQNLFFVESYNSAQDIDVIYLNNNKYNVLTVGAISFMSIGANANDTFKIKFEPQNDSVFRFIKNSGQGYIPYSIMILGDNNRYQSGPVEITVKNKTVQGYTWHEFLELGITNVNPNNTPLIGGDYTSTIVVTLIKD